MNTPVTDTPSPEQVSAFNLTSEEAEDSTGPILETDVEQAHTIAIHVTSTIEAIDPDRDEEPIVTKTM
jgi:hypothetical protein